MSDEPRSNGRLGRLADEAKGLMDDTRDWVEAKFRLLELDFEEKLDRMASQAIATGVVAFLGALALTFALVAAALGLGAWWDSNTLGFLAVAGVLLVAAAVIHAMRPRFVRGSLGLDERRADPEKQLPGSTAPQLPPVIANPKEEEEHA